MSDASADGGKLAKLTHIHPLQGNIQLNLANFHYFKLMVAPDQS